MGFNDINLQVSGPQQPASIYKTKVLKGQVPFATQVTEPNTKYVIKHNFDLGDESVTIPENCVLEFDGGSLSNGTLVGDDTITINYTGNCILSGNFTETNKITIFKAQERLDDTAYISNIIEHFKNSVILFKNATYNINGNYHTDKHFGLYFCNNNQYIFNGSTFKQINTTDKESKIFKIANVDGVVFEDFTIEGDLEEHTIVSGTTDEWNYGIQFAADNKNIILRNVIIRNFTGDCINFYDSSHEVANIIVQNCKFSGARRGCVSIENIKGLIINNCTFIKSSDVYIAPDFFIDIEPLTEYHNVVDYVKITNNTFYSEKQIHIGLLVTPYEANSVLNVEISGNYFYGNPPQNGYMNFPTQYIIKEKLICKDNVLKVTSNEYPLNPDLGELFNVSKGCNLVVENLYVEGYVDNTIGIRVWANNSKCVFNNCTFKNCKILTGRQTDTDDVSRPTTVLNNCQVTYDISTTSVLYSVRRGVYEINNSTIISKGKCILSLASSYRIYNSYLQSKQSFVADLKVAGTIIEEESVLGFYAEGCTLLSPESSILSGGGALSVHLKSCTISGNSCADLSAHKRNNTYYDTIVFEDCNITTKKSDGFILSATNYVSAVFSRCYISVNGSQLYYSPGVPVTFNNCNINGTRENPCYSDNYSSVSYVNTSINGSLTVDTGESTESYTKYSGLPIAGVNKFDISKNVPMWWDGARWGNANGYSAEAPKKGNTASRPVGKHVEGGVSVGVLSPTKDIGFPYYDTDIKKTIYAASINSNTGVVTWVDYDGISLDVKRMGTFSEKPYYESIYLGFKYLCTDRKIDTDPSSNTFMQVIPITNYTGCLEIYSFGTNWFDIFGRVVS